VCGSRRENDEGVEEDDSENKTNKEQKVIPERIERVWYYISPEHKGS
jgi:hypothetical protein